MFLVHAVCSGKPYKEQEFQTLEAAKAYQAELWAMKHYWVPLYRGDEVDIIKRQIAASRSI